MTDTLFDAAERHAKIQEATQALDLGIRTAEENAHEGFLQDIRDAITWGAHMYPTFTTDEVLGRLEQLELVNGGNTTAIGPILQHMEREGLVEKTGELMRTTRKQRHRSLTGWRAA